MLNLLFNGVEYHLPTTWQEVPLNDYLAHLHAEDAYGDGLEWLTRYKGLDVVALEECGQDILKHFTALLKLPPIDAPPIDVGQKPFGLMIDAYSHVQAKNTSAAVQKYYECSGMVYDTLGPFLQWRASWEKFWTRWKWVGELDFGRQNASRMYLDRVKAFGLYAIVDSLSPTVADDDITIKQAANHVYMKYSLRQLNKAEMVNLQAAATNKPKRRG